MPTRFFVWLGSRRSRKYPIAEEATLLDKAAAAGLPVPPGGILLDEFYRFVSQQGLVVFGPGRVSTPDPAAVYEALFRVARFPKQTEPVAIRPVFSAGVDGDQQRLDRFTVRLSVDFTSPEQVAATLREVWSSGQSFSSEAAGRRLDVLVMSMVSAMVTGVAISDNNRRLDHVEYVIDRTRGQPLEIARLRFLGSPDPSLPPFARRLQRLLRGLRRTLGSGDLEVKWADDGRICWLLQVRPLA